MARQSYKKWRTVQDFGIRTTAILPAWKAGDEVEVIGTAVRGRIVRPTTLDYSMWEFELTVSEKVHGGKNRFMVTHANNLRLAAPRSSRPAPHVGAGRGGYCESPHCPGPLYPGGYCDC